MGAEARGIPEGRGGGVLSSSPGLSWGHMLYFCRGGNLVLKAGVRGTSWTQSLLEPWAFSGPQGPPGDAFFMKRPFTAKAVCFTLCRVSRLSTSVISFNPPGVPGGRTPSLLGDGPEGYGLQPVGVQPGPTPPRLLSDHHHAS